MREKKDLKLNKTLVFLILILTGSVLFSQSRRSADKFVYNNKTKIFTYTGNSKLEDKDVTITSYLMKFFREEEVATFNTKVIILSKEDNTQIHSGFVKYNAKTKIAGITKNPILISEVNDLTIKSKYMKRDFNTPFAEALTNVKLKHINEEDKTLTEGFSDKMIYNVDTEIALLTGDPYLLKDKEDEIYGEVIEYNAKLDTANVIGDAIAYILQTNEMVDNGEDEGDNTLKTNYNVITADRFFMEQRSEENGNANMLYAYGDIKVMFHEENMILKGEYAIYNVDKEHMFIYDNPSIRIPDKSIVAFGEVIEYKKENGFKDIIFHNDVVLVNYADGVTLEGDLLHLDPDTKIATVSQNPYAYIENRQYKIESVSIQMFDSNEKIRANGDVKVYSKDLNSNSSWLIYYNNIKKIKLWGGRPLIDKDDSIITAREIIYDLDTEVIEGSIVSGQMPD